jgi:hypothetical protein
MFIDATAEIRPRLIFALDGEPGSGRTRFVLSAPRPIYVVLLDTGGLEGVLEDPNDVKVASYDMRKDLKQDEAKRVAQEVEDDIAEAREIARTVVIDKATALWQLFRLAEFGRLSKERSRNYEFVNTRMSELLRSYVDSDTNLLLIHDYADAYEGDTKVGVKRAGFGGTEGIVRHAATFTKANPAKGVPFGMVVSKCTTHWDLVGTEFTGDDITFPNYASQAVPQVDPGLWL